MNEILNRTESIGYYQSLRGYLNPDSQGGVFLKLPLSPVGQKGGETDPVRWEQVGPASDLAQAALSLDEQTPVTELFLLAQADDPRVHSSELATLTNTDIETLWQEALVRVKPPAVSLCRQDRQGHWQACLPLFVCRHKATFFHPPCPECGADLVLCRDDQLLEQAGRPVFTSSLVRHLYCEACYQTNPVFYVKAVSGEPRTGILDSRTLIEQFSKLLAKNDLAEKLPCIGCEASGQCFGPDNLVFQRMAAVRFYPFYMLCQPVQSIHSLDFLALLSGAAPERLEDDLSAQSRTLRLAGLRRSCSAWEGRRGLHFQGDSRYFAEVLFLKLIFLRSLMDMTGALSGPAAQIVSRMSLDGVWVRLPDMAPRLPLFWNFSLCCVDAVGAPAGPSDHALLQGLQTALFLSRAWFYVLLANDRHAFADVLKNIELLAEDETAENDIHEQDLFDPRHIFYGEPAQDIDAQWLPFWRQSVDLGFAFFKSMSKDRTDPDIDTLAQNLDRLCGELHQAMFNAPAGRPAAAAQVCAQPSDQPIKTILEAIHVKWSQQAGPPETTAAAAHAEVHVDEDGDVEETIILTDTAAYGHMERGGAPPSGPDPDKTIVVPPPTASPGQKKPAFDDIEKTVLITPKPAPAPPDQDLDKTVMIQGPDSASQNDDLEKTVLITPQSPQQPVRKPSKTGPPPTAAQNGEEDLEQTVIQGSQPPKTRAGRPVPPPSPKSDAEDDLDATVIIDPNKLKNRKP